MKYPTRSLTLLLFIALTGPVLAAPLTFDFKDPKGVNNIIFKLDAPLEAINGAATGISGTVTFDPAHPETIKGKLAAAAASLHVGNPMMKEHLHSDKWLDVAKHPEITFEATKVSHAKTEANVTTADVGGKLTIKGITQELTIPVKFTYLKDRLQDRIPNLKGDLLVIRSKFPIKRTDFGIAPGNVEQKVSNEIEIELSLAGASAR